MINLGKFYNCVTLNVLFICIFIFFLFFSNTVSHSGFLKTEYFPYNLKKPDYQYKLPECLNEISGISFYKKDKIGCIQDEDAIIYIFNLKKGKITDKYKFGKEGDYEDIAIIDKTAYVLKNNGQIYRVKNFASKERKIKKYETALSQKNNTEGLCFDPLLNSLLIACKYSPSIDKITYKGKKAIYRFDLKENEFISKPHILISLDEIDDAKDYNSFTRFSITLAKKLNILKEDIGFQPSGIAVHPVTRHIYIISSIGKLIIKLNRKGKLLDVHTLDNKLFVQPEGICFSEDGDLYISNESQGGRGNILKFNYRNK